MTQFEIVLRTPITVKEGRREVQKKVAEVITVDLPEIDGGRDVLEIRGSHPLTLHQTQGGDLFDVRSRHRDEAGKHWIMSDGPRGGVKHSNKIVFESDVPAADLKGDAARTYKAALPATIKAIEETLTLVGGRPATKVSYRPMFALVDGQHAPSVLVGEIPMALMNGRGAIMPWGDFERVARIDHGIDVMQFDADAMARFDPSEQERLTTAEAYAKVVLDQGSLRLTGSPTAFLRDFADAKDALDHGDVVEAWRMIAQAGTHEFDAWSRSNPFADRSYMLVASSLRDLARPQFENAEDLTRTDAFLNALSVYGDGAFFDTAAEIERIIWSDPHRVMAALIDETQDWEDALSGERPSLVTARAEAVAALQNGAPLSLRGPLAALYEEARDWEDALSGERPTLTKVMEDADRLIHRLVPERPTFRQPQLDADSAYARSVMRP